MVYGAMLASSIAVVTALEAWVQLQGAGGASGLLASATRETILAIAIPLLVVGALVAIRWGARTLSPHRAGPDGSPPAAPPVAQHPQPR
jgi:hypothetical protein